MGVLVFIATDRLYFSGTLPVTQFKLGRPVIPGLIFFLNPQLTTEPAGKRASHCATLPPMFEVRPVNENMGRHSRSSRFAFDESNMYMMISKEKLVIMMTMVVMVLVVVVVLVIVVLVASVLSMVMLMMMMSVITGKMLMKIQR